MLGTGKQYSHVFSPRHDVLQGDKYVDRELYKEKQPEKKKGFLTSDYVKRDEFSNTIRTEQWREQLTVSASA